MEPTTIPNFAWFRRSILFPNDKFAIKSDTVKPIPPRTDTDASIAHVEPAGFGVNRSIIASHENEKIPTNFPTTSHKITARLTPSKIVLGSIFRRNIPALANANNGNMK